MGAFKSFEAKDIISTPFIVNKSFSFYGDSEFTGSGLDKFIGFSQSGLFSTSTENDILNYSLNVFASQSQVSVKIPQAYLVPNLTLAEDFPNAALENESYLSDGVIYFPQNIKNTELYATFSGNYSFYSNPNVGIYEIYSIALLYPASYPQDPPVFIAPDIFVTNSNFTGGTLISRTFEIPTTFTPSEGDYIRIIYSPIYISGNGNEVGTPLTFETLDTSFIISSQSVAPSASNLLTGINYTEYQRSIYNSIKQLYYTNYIGNPYPIPTSSYDTSSNIYTQFDNYLQSYPLDVRYFPTQSNSKIGVINVPSKVYGEYIKPGTFLYQSASVYVYDDGEGNLLNSIDNNKCGNVIYSHGLAIITTCSFADLDSFITSSNTTC
jgi:hypothetical protein